MMSRSTSTDPAVSGTLWISGVPSADSAVELAPPSGRPQFVSPGLDGAYLERCYELVRGAPAFRLRQQGLWTPELERDWPRRIGGSPHTTAQTFHVLRCGAAWYGAFAALTDARIEWLNARPLVNDASPARAASLPGRLVHQANVLRALARLAREAATIRDYAADWLLRIDYRGRP